MPHPSPFNNAQRLLVGLLCLSCCLVNLQANAQLATLPTPRLLTLMPMGGQVGSIVEVSITGTDLIEATELRFSSPKIIAKPSATPNKFTVTIAADAARGLYEARVMTRFGISTARVFAVGGLAEMTRTKANNTPETALELPLNTVCNAAATATAVDYYGCRLAKGKRVLVDCATSEIDSRLTKVVIIADAQDRDLLVNRRGGLLDFTAPSEGRYLIKVHSLTFEGGAEHFYRLTLTDGPRVDFVFPPMANAKASVFGRNLGNAVDAKTLADAVPLVRREAQLEPLQAAPLSFSAQSSVLPLAAVGVDAFSWMLPEAGALPQCLSIMRSSGAVSMEIEPNDKAAQAQRITLPCDIAGQFFPAADVDSYEFTAKKGEVWWVEVISQRLGLPTDPFVLVQHVAKDAQGVETLTDVAEMNDIANPAPVANAISAYDAGSADVLAKLEIKEDGVHRLVVRDLFGGTRSQPRHIYRLCVRQAAPDFSLVAWAFHAPNVGNDRSAPARPLDLRNGGTMALQVAVLRCDGFDGEIELSAENLPPGVHATGFKVVADKTQGVILLTANEKAARGLSTVRLMGRAVVKGAPVMHPCRLASVIWHVPDSGQEIPKTRLLDEVVVSVCGVETAPVTMAAAENKVYEAKVGEKLSIPLKITWRGEPTSAMKLKALGNGFEAFKEGDVPLKAETAKMELDLAALKLPAGEHTLAFHGIAKGKYRLNPEAQPRDYADVVVSEAIRISIKAMEVKK